MSGTSQPLTPPPLAAVPRLKIGSSGRVDPEQLQPAAVEADPVARPDRAITRAAVIVQLGLRGQPVGWSPGRANRSHCRGS